MLIFLLFSIVSTENIIKNPSFEDFDSNNKLLYWNIPENVEISSVSHSGKKSLKFKIKEKNLYVYQVIELDKGFQYEICAHIKFSNNVRRRLLGMKIRSYNFDENYDSRSYFGWTDWQKVCIITASIKKPSKYSDPYYFILYSYSTDQYSEGYVDDISIKRINFRIGISNDRDEVNDRVNVIYQIYGDKQTYNLSDFELKTRIRDNNKIYCENNIKISSFFFTNSISIKKFNLKINNYYQVESILNNKKDNIKEVSLYTI